MSRSSDRLITRVSIRLLLHSLTIRYDSVLELRTAFELYIPLLDVRTFAPELELAKFFRYFRPSTF